MANFNIARQIGNIKIEQYKARLENQEIFKLYYSKKYKSVKLSELLNGQKLQRKRPVFFMQ